DAKAAGKALARVEAEAPGRPSGGSLGDGRAPSRRYRPRRAGTRLGGRPRGRGGRPDPETALDPFARGTPAAAPGGALASRLHLGHHPGSVRRRTRTRTRGLSPECPFRATSFAERS